jgi:hypothetical protein
VLLAIAEPDAEPLWAAAQVAVKQELSKGTPRPGSNSKRSSPGVLAMPGRTPSKSSNPAVARAPRPSAPGGDETRADRPPARRSPVGLIVGLAVAVIALGAGAFVLLKPAPTPVVEAERPPDVKPPDVKPDVPTPKADVDVTLSADPKETRFVVNGETLSCNPCTLSRPPGTKLTVKAGAERFVDSELEVVFDKAHETHVALAPVPAATPGKKPKKPKSLTVDEANPYR